MIEAKERRRGEQVARETLAARCGGQVNPFRGQTNARALWAPGTDGTWMAQAAKRASEGNAQRQLQEEGQETVYYSKLRACNTASLVRPQASAGALAYSPLEMVRSSLDEIQYHARREGR